MSTPRLRLRFPQLRRIDLVSFSLYSQEPDISLSVPAGVMCIAGANGVGKSTFLSAGNFAITARIPNPRRSYTSANEYFEEALSFTEEFFDGRIAERDRSTATVSVALQLGHDTFELTRGVFEPSGLRAFRILREGPKKKVVEFDGSGFTDEERQQRYSQLLAAAIGLKTFQQFVFLQHFVLTFDESRNLLFWDAKALDAALFLAFGRDPDEHDQADQYRRQMEREESKARNSKWHSHRLKRSLDELLSASGAAKKPKNIAILEQAFDALHERELQLVFGAPAGARQAAPPPSAGGETVEVNIRIVPFCAVDTAGKPIYDLRQDEVELRIGGKAVSIDTLDRSAAAQSGMAGTAANERSPSSATPSGPERTVIFLFDTAFTSPSGVRNSRVVAQKLGSQPRACEKLL